MQQMCEKIMSMGLDHKRKGVSAMSQMDNDDMGTWDSLAIANS